MYTEFEATFTNINLDDVRKKLVQVNAKLIRQEYLQKRFVFELPKGHEIKGGWLRVRDEGDKITMSLKIIDGDKIENQKETQLEVDNFDNAVNFLSNIGCTKKAYQESKRELWKLDDVEITIDQWPFLEPFVEIEGKSEKEVIDIANLLGFDYTKAKFCSVDTLYAQKDSLTEDQVNNHTPEILFDGKNPFVSPKS
jgi:adenylate cyclase class 2